MNPMIECMVIPSDCLDALKRMPADSIDSMVTDPPAGIKFMGKEWDKSDGFIPFMTSVMREALRVLKPGAHAFVWAIPRTSHWTATALEDAGFEIRDVVTHLFGSGFPKSLDVSKAIDKAAGAEREVIGYRDPKGSVHGDAKPDSTGSHIYSGELTSSNAVTPEAKLWQGFGTALKPASEHWILCRKPLGERTVAANVLKYGTGGINIDASRISGRPRATDGDKNIRTQDNLNGRYSGGMPLGEYPVAAGRFPANLVLSHCDDCVEVGVKEVGGGKFKGPNARPRNNGLGLGTDTIRSGASGAPDNYGTETVPAWQCSPGCAVAELDRQSGSLKFSYATNEGKASSIYGGELKSERNIVNKQRQGDSGGASRFFKVFSSSAKADIDSSCDANTVENHSSLQSLLEDSVLKLAAIEAVLEDRQLRSIATRFTIDIQTELKKSDELNTQQILNIVGRYSQELAHIESLNDNPAKLAEIKKLTDITMTIRNLLMSDGYAGNATLSSMQLNLEHGEKDLKSRYIYCAKASKRERNEGCEGEVKEKQGARPNSKDMSGKFPDHDHRPAGGNNHPTVKPIRLMQYLIRMVTPPGGIVLDPFMGSGSTGVAAVSSGFNFIGIEKEPEYLTIAWKRITHVVHKGDNE
jgi:site-specific DNA-methyltransferase (adenine-specific)